MSWARIENRGWKIATAAAPARCGAILCLLSSILSQTLSVGVAAAARADDPKPATDYLLHFPGIAGYHNMDRQLLRGLRNGGFDGEIEVRDWPGEAPGLAALFARKRNHEQAQAVADAIAERRRDHPSARIILTAHSGGAGIVVWALEKLPGDVKVDTVLLLAPALSPEYDLSKALARVRGRMYAFTSTYDIVLGPGTTTFGTIDGVKGEAAGRCGFIVPEHADREAYTNLVQMPYDTKWLREGNLGDHIGAMGWQFSKNVLAPLLVAGAAPADGKAPETANPQAKSTAARRPMSLAASQDDRSVAPGPRAAQSAPAHAP